MGVEAIHHGDGTSSEILPRHCSVNITFYYFSSKQYQGKSENQPNLLANIIAILSDWILLMPLCSHYKAVPGLKKKKIVHLYMIYIHI